MRRTILIGFLWAVLSVGGMPVSADEAAKPPAPNIEIPEDGCPPNMLGVWVPGTEDGRRFFGNVMITSNSMEIGAFGRFGLETAEPLLDGIDWTNAPTPPVAPGDIAEKTPRLLKLSRPFSPSPDLLRKPENTIYQDIQDMNYALIYYGQVHYGVGNATSCWLEISFLKEKIDAAYFAARDFHKFMKFARRHYLILVPPEYSKQE